jgi:hypothetical protein
MTQNGALSALTADQPMFNFCAWSGVAKNKTKDTIISRRKRVDMFSARLEQFANRTAAPLKRNRYAIETCRPTERSFTSLLQETRCC